MVLGFRTRDVRLHALLLVLLTVLYLGFWMLRVRNGTAPDEYANMGIANYVLQHLPLTSRSYSTVYLDYPGVSILGAASALVFGTGIGETRQILVPLFTAIFGLLLYAVTRHVIGDSRLAFLASAMAVVGNLVWVHYQAFAPILLGYLVLFALLLSISGNSKGMYILLPGLVIAYLPSSILFILILLSLWVIDYRSKNLCGRNRRMYAQPVVYSTVMFLAWNVFWASLTYGNVLSLFERFVTQGFQFQWVSTLYGAISNVPRWVTYTEYFWFSGIEIAGSVAAFYFFFVAKDKRDTYRVLLAGFIGTLILGGASFLAPGGIQFSRLLYYAPIFFPSLLVLLMTKKVPKNKVFAVLAIGMIFLAFPTFVVQDRSVALSVVYDYELSLGNFLANHVGSQETTIVTDQLTSGVMQYYLSDAQFIAPSYNVGSLFASFTMSSNSLVILTYKSEGNLMFTYGPNVTETYILNVTNALNKNPLIYSSELAEVYMTYLPHSN